MFKKSFKWIGIISLFCAIVIPLAHTYKNWNQSERQKQMILKNKIKNQNYTEIPYIEIPKYGIQKIIKDSTDPKILIQNYVGIWNQNKDLRKVNNIVLAGHNVKTVFGKIHKMEKEDEITIHYKDQTYRYEVVIQKIIGVTELHYLEETNEKRVTLVTCTSDDQKRLIIIGDYKKSY